MKNIYSTILYFLLAPFLAFAQRNTIVTTELQPFILSGYSLYDYVEGDMNKDGIKDIALILQMENEDSLKYQIQDRDSLRRPFILLLRDKSKLLTSILRNDNLIYCALCGGGMGDPYEGMKIEKSTLTFNFYGGSSDRWALEYKFAYDGKNDWKLQYERQNNYSTHNPDKQSAEALNGDEFIDNSIFNFSIYNKDHSLINWVVVATKTFFYNTANINAKPRKGYVVKGDVVECIRELKNFIYVLYKSKKGTIFSGYLLKQHLKKE
jgi:hypothetical protein